MGKLEIRQIPGGASVFLESPDTAGQTVWYVDSTNGTNGAGYGREPGAKALASLAYLITNATTLGLAAGDDIELAASHNEGIDDAQIDLATAGLTIYGHPQAVGSRRPTFDFDHANAEITISANDITIRNVILRPSITSVLIGIEIASGYTGTCLENIEWTIGEDGAGADEFVKALVLTSGAHDTIMRDLNILAHASAAQATHGIHVAAASNRLTIDSVRIDGPYATGGIVEAAAGLNHRVVGNSVDTSGTNYSFHASSTFAERNGNLDGGAPEDAADNLIGRNDNNNVADTSSVVSNVDGSVLERAEAIQQLISGGAVGIATWPSAAAPANAGNLAASLRDVWDVLRNGTGGSEPTTNKSIIDCLGATLAAMDAAAAPSNTVSLAAVLRDTWDVLRNGTGGTEPGTNKSIIDAIGSDGATAAAATAATATSLFGAIGTNEADATTPFASNNVQANADGTVLEREEYIQTQANKIDSVTLATSPTANSLATYIASGGTALGTQLAASKSIIDVIGATGAAFATAERASATASIAGVLRELSDYAGLRCIEKTDGAVLAVADPLFTITGGPIMVLEFVGIVTTVIGGAANCQIQIVVTEPAGTVNLSTDVAIDTDAAGTSYTFTAATPGVLTPTTAGALDQVPVIRWLCPIGTIQADTDAAQTGVIKWYMTYRPLSPNSRVVAAA